MAFIPSYGFSKDDHRRVSDVVRHVENSHLGEARKGSSVSVSDPVRRGVTTSAITARTSLSGVITPGSGYAQFYDYDHSLNRISLSTEEYLIKNDWTESIATGKEALFHWRGVWWIDGWKC